MNSTCIISELDNQWYDEVEKLVKEVFDNYIGSDYSKEGVLSFYRYISKESFKKRRVSNAYNLFGAFDDNSLIGVLEVRDKSHISLFFVKRDYQRKGIGRKLFDTVFQLYSNTAIDAEGKVSLSAEITANASTYAVPIYEKLGFKKVCGEIIKNGITYIPMLRQESNEKYKNNSCINIHFNV